MKKIIYAIILGIALVNVCYSMDEGTNLAERIGPIEVYGDIGLSSALSPEALKDYRRTGFNFGIGAGKGMNMNVGKFDISVGGRIDYSSLDFYVDEFLRKEKGIEEGYSITGGETSILTLLGTAKVILSGIISPYFYGGLGFFRFSIKDATMYDLISYENEPIPGSSENTFGISLGAGVEAGTPFGLFAEGQYIIGFTESSTQLLFPIKLGVIYKWE